MNDDGSGLAVVAGFPAEFYPSGEPSRQLHAGKALVFRVARRIE